ncbi:DUF1702 family protein [Catenulispora subtropica]|uniref:DUF1702 family protein n=1 Tax=Catenulispora subtropica TaxID=450798 RepID=A0ABN2T696_9ACTN
MPPVLGVLRRVALAPSLAAVGFRKRGFPASAHDLESIPQSVVCGFEWGIEARRPWEVERRLSMVDPELRGFAFEGATMAYTVRDAMAAGRGHRTRDLLAGPGAPHIFLAYIGIGFAMARLPRVLWKKVLPDLPPSPYHPTMSWFAVDGYGFDRAYFHTRKWVDRQYRPRPYPWAGDKDYFLRAVDHGIGRALWFIHGAEPGPVADAVRRFDPARQADLWSGVGLAATFAGGCTAQGLAGLCDEAGGHRPEVALGAVLAVKARHHSGHVPPHVVASLAALTGLTVAEAVDLADRTEVPFDTPGPVPPYERWRGRIRESFVAATEPTAS